MRNFKFRVWDGKLMHEVGELHWIAGGVKFYGPGVGSGWIKGTINYHQFPDLKGEDINILMQCSSFKDMNKKDIYEGDIVKTRDGRCVIEWSENQKIQGKCRAAFLARALYPLIGLTVLGSYHYPEDVEVIGNIYESPNFISPKRHKHETRIE